MTHPYLQKCLELSERAKKSTNPDDAFEFLAVGVDALPKVCEALKITINILKMVRDHYSVVVIGKETCTEVLEAIDNIFNDADGG